MNVRIVCDQRAGQWVARAIRSDNGDPFGVEYAAPTADEATTRLQRWLDWQGDHSAALDALQQAERAYHRTIAGSAFATGSDNVSALEAQKDALQVVEAARTQLDDVRARKPE